MTCEEYEWWDEFCSMWGDIFGDDRPCYLEDLDIAGQTN